MILLKYWKNDKGRCDSNGNSGLFLHDECSNEDFDRPLLRTYTEMGNKEFYFIATAAEGDRKLMERTIDTFQGFFRLLGESGYQRGCVWSRCLAYRRNK